MFKKIVIANRGEIAERIQHAAKELGIQTVALYSSIDANLQHLKFADEAICIGGESTRDSYLNADAIISAAKLVQADAIHPGYGFFAENADFAELAENNGLVFIGPSPDIIRLMNNKIAARKLMHEYNLQCVPGSNFALTTYSEENSQLAKKIGYPIVIKSAYGGGGRAMKVVHRGEHLDQIIRKTREDAQVDFKHDDVYMEKLLKSPRHIEIQILGDGLGNAVHFGERDCSTQHWNKKVIEEAPSPIMSAEMRAELGEHCVRICKAIKYRGVGTFEFLYKNHNFYFIEMNTRIQVGHTITELVTNCDLVKEQIKIAAGEGLTLQQSDITFKGHALECRIYAEDPMTFERSTGMISFLHMPGGPGVRIDSHIYAGYNLPSTYDPLIMKLITYGENRETAIKRMSATIDELAIMGIKTNIPLLESILNDINFLKGKVRLNYLEKKLGPQDGRA